MFEDAKVGDRVWDFIFGWGTIYDIILDDYYPIKVEFEKDIIRSYTLDGALFKGSKENPSLFWDEIKFEIPKRPFNLEDFIYKKLKLKKFIPHESNYFLFWDNNSQKISYDINREWEYLQPYFEKENIKFVIKTLNEKGIMKEQFFTAYKNVFGGC